MPPEERLHAAVEHMLGELRSPLAAELRAFADGLDRQAAAAREQAVREAADAAAAEVRRRADADREEARRTAQAHLEDAERALGERLAAVQRELDDVRRGADDTRRLMQAGREASDALRAQLDAARAEIADLRRRAESHTAAAHESRILLDGIRSLDDARALGDVLDRLVHVRPSADERQAVYVLRGDLLRRWRATGFPETGSSAGIEPAGREPEKREVRVADAGIVADALRSGRAEVRGPGGPASSFPPGADGRLAVAVPIRIGGAMVAVLYADTPRHDAAGDGRWPALYEVLARHASRVLEAMAIQRAAGLLPQGGLAASSAAGHAGGGMS